MGAQTQNVVSLHATLDINAAAALCNEILGKRGAELSLDASNVQKLGGQTLQVILAASLLWKLDQRFFEIVSPSDRFLQDWRLFGASEEFIGVSSQEIQS